MQEENNSLLKNDTWDLVLLIKGHKLFHCKWLYKTKFLIDESVDNFKSTLFPKVSQRLKVLITQKIFPLLQRRIQFRLVLSLIDSQGTSMEVKITFLHGNL
jgi:hypothetical protein